MKEQKESVKDSGTALGKVSIDTTVDSTNPKKVYVAPKLSYEGKWDTTTMQGGSDFGGVLNP